MLALDMGMETWGMTSESTVLPLGDKVFSYGL